MILTLTTYTPPPPPPPPSSSPPHQHREIGLIAFSVTPSLLSSSSDDDIHAVRGSTSPLELRVSYAKQLLDVLRGDPDYQSYVSRVKDRFVDEIEKEILDYVSRGGGSS